MDDRADLVMTRGASLPAVARVGAMSMEAIGKVYEWEMINLLRPQIPVFIDHVIHGGMYARTAFMPAAGRYTGALVKVPTILNVRGNVLVHIGKDDPVEVVDYCVLIASANRKQAFLTRTDTYLTMMMATDAKTVEQAERAFTDEWHLLASHRDPAFNHVTITGE